MSNAAKKWQVFVRKSAKHKWRVYGTYETRDAARWMNGCLRDGYANMMGMHDGVGFGNTKVVRKITGGV